MFGKLTVAKIESAFPSKGNTFKVDGSRRSYANAYWVPICLLDEVRSAYAEAGKKIRVRYRGPRVQSVDRKMKMYRRHGYYYRHLCQAKQDCLKQDATHFCVYVQN